MSPPPTAACSAWKSSATATPGPCVCSSCNSKASSRKGPSLAGAGLTQRQELLDFVRAELLARAPLCPHRLQPVCRQLKKQAELLAFVEDLDRDIGSLAAWAHVPEAVIRELVVVQELPASC